MKILKKLLIVFVFCFWLLNIVKADVLPEDSHYVNKCIKIENPGLVSWYKPVMLTIGTRAGIKSFTDWTFSEIEAWKCLSIPWCNWWSYSCISYIYLIRNGINMEVINQHNIKEITKFQNYKLNTFYSLIKFVFAFPKNYMEYPESKLWIDFIKFDQSLHWWYYVRNSSKMTYETITYRIIEQDWVYRLKIVQRESDETWEIVIENLEISWDSISSVKSVKDTYIFKFIISRITTIILETIILFLICKLFFKQDEIKNWKIILTWIVTSTCTLPILWFVLPNIFHNWTVFAIIGEVFVTIVEVFIIKYMLNIKRRKALIASTACNLFSVLIWLFL